jgi:hypothetical protein
VSELKGIGDRLQTLEETHVKVRKALCAAAGVYPWSFLGQTCDVFGTLQSVPCRAHQRAPAPETGRRIHALLFIERGLSRAAGNVGSGDLGADGRQQTPFEDRLASERESGASCVAPRSRRKRL